MKRTIETCLFAGCLTLSIQAFGSDSDCRLPEMNHSGFWNTLFGKLTLDDSRTRQKDQLTDKYIGSSITDFEWRRDFLGSLNCQRAFASDLQIQVGSQYQTLKPNKPEVPSIESLRGYSNLNGS